MEKIIEYTNNDIGKEIKDLKDSIANEKKSNEKEMQLFMDTVDVWSKPYIGTSVTMTKELKRIEKKGNNGCNNAD